MLAFKRKISLTGFLLLLILVFSDARTGRYRCMWREDPATTMVIGWDQISGSNPVLYIDMVDHGGNADHYASTVTPSHQIVSKGMNNHYIRLAGLLPNTKYYFVIKDSEGVSERFCFKTAPGSPNERLSIIAGGDSRNHREARLSANKLVSKLRPHCVMFGGDMTAGDSDGEWQEWFDDWQATIGSDGCLFPIIVTRGNHESTNSTLVDLFDVKSTELYYALTLGGSLLRIYTLNSLIPSGGEQMSWLERDLKANTPVIWKFAQYHHTIRPHTESKPEQDELLLNWATLFHKHGVDVAVESDAHVVKWTYPIRPSGDPGSEEGFIRDDQRGTVYIGEGCWGAPLRENNDDKVWTRNSGSFNQFKWIFVDRYSVEIRTIKTDAADQVGEVRHDHIFSPPVGLVTWKPSNGEVVVLENTRGIQPPSFSHPEDEILVTKTATQIQQVVADMKGADIKVQWSTQNESSSMHFELQRSTDGGKLFSTVATISGKGPGGNFYQCTDPGAASRHPLQNISYRLKCVYLDGKHTFHNPELNYRKSAGVPPASLPEIGTLAMDPDTGKITFKFELNSHANVTAIFIDNKAERIIGRQDLAGAPGDNLKSINVNPLPPGEYLLVLKAGETILSRYKFRR